MGFFSYDYFKNLKRPDVYLAYPNKRIIGCLKVHDLKTDLIANACDKASFTIYSHENGIKNNDYDGVTLGNYILVQNINWFRIDELTIFNKDSDDEYKEISALSLESELGQTYLTSFGSLGADNDEQGGLDRYCLYNVTDQDHSILHIFLQSNPGWSIRYVDPDISKEYRNFQDDSVSSYSFLTDKVADVFECIFIFDSFEKSISAYKLEKLGNDTGITLLYRNVIASLKKASSEDDVKTVLTVTGGNDDRTNTPLGIIDVNIGGTNQIYNFSYFLPMMSSDLRAGLQKYDQKCKENEAAYQTRNSTLRSKYDELGALNSKIPDEGEQSTDWTKFGLRELQEKEIIYKTNMSLYTGESETEQYQRNQKIHAAIEKEIGVRKGQIAAKEAEINNLLKEISKLVVNLRSVLGNKLYAELGPFIREDTLTDDSFIATNTMTDREILEMQQALLKHAHSELEKVCYPQYTLEIDLINFTVDHDYKRFTDAMELFNIIHIDLEDGNKPMAVRLLKLQINWDDLSDFSVTFSNKDTLDESWNILDEVKKQAEDTASKIDFSTGAWNKAASTSVEMNKYMNSILDATKQQLVTNENNEIKIDATGLMGKKWLPEKQAYDPAQMWITHNTLAITTDSWSSVGLALGYIKVNNDYFFGLAADKVYGRLLMGQGLYIQNKSGTYTINNDGLAAKNGSYQVKINPNQPTEIFSISIENKKLLYVDANSKKLKFEGDIESKSGHIASYVISANDLTSGKVGMSSATSTDAVAFWAGNTDRNNAPFRVTNQGNLTCSSGRIANYTISANDLISGNVGMSSSTSSGAVAFWAGSTSRNSAPFRIDNNGNGWASSLNITGGSLKIGNKFKVDTTGKMTASDGVFSGHISATSGEIGYWQIEDGKITGGSSSIITGGTLSGTSLRTGKAWGSLDNKKYMLMADSEGVSIGEFNVEYSRGRYVLNSWDERTGMSPEPSENGQLYLWAGWSGHENRGLLVRKNSRGGATTWIEELLVNDINILDQIDELWAAINSGGGSGGSGCSCNKGDGGETPCNSGGDVDPCSGDGDCTREVEGPGCYLGV